MNTYQPMNCDLYDYLEIACLRGYRLDIELKDGARLEARALDTRTSAEKEEFLILERRTASRKSVWINCWPSRRWTPMRSSAGWCSPMPFARSEAGFRPATCRRPRAIRCR